MKASMKNNKLFGNKLIQTNHTFIHLHLKSFFFWVGDKAVELQLATPEITQNLCQWQW